ncbi:hypothetical protein FB451DRAFT_1099431 [Mycena latifolia]|nr:hypothetical protein FB451DRAFT_1099431 [Mycena latifolia]
MKNTVVTRSASKARKSTSNDDVSGIPQSTLSAKRKLEPVEPAADDPASKRAKSASQTFTKHSRFWALDGNVILQFGGVAFKLHRSRLSTQSVWFEKLFERRAGWEEPLEADEEDIKDVAVEDMDGCDVYDLQPFGKMKDFEALLTAMEDAVDFYYSSPRFLTVAAVFRAAASFKFAKFLAFTRQYLLEMFSENLGHLDARVVPNPTAAIILGREWNLPRILKRAFYELIRTPPHDPTYLDGEDDTAFAHHLQGLDVQDVIRLTDAQKHLTAAWLAALSPSGPPCPCMPSCAAAKRSGITNGAVLLGRDQLLQKFQYDPIRGLEALRGVRWIRTYAFCEACAGTRNASLRAKKEELWSDMDRWLDIPVDDEV